MKIPLKYQVFERIVPMGDTTAQTLQDSMTGWNRLNELFLLGVSEDDLKRMVILELMGPKRASIINRLLGRLTKLERIRIKQRIARL
jgi:hypothetical protein